jgi:predicted TPR repeat methyltransferase
MSITPPNLSAEALNLCFTEACRAQTEGRLEEAREQYLLLLGYLPESSLLHYNIGLVYYGLQDFSQALLEFSQALTSGPEEVDTLFNLALCQKKTGDCGAAIITYRQVLATTPDHTDCWYNLAGCYRDIHDDEQAKSCYHRVLAIDAEYQPAVNNLAYLYHRTDNVEQAAVYYRQLLVLRPEDDSAQYMLASLLGTPLDHAPESYIRNFFNTYAEGFEHSLVVELEYDNPRKLYECFRNCSGHQATYDHGLDLGCGTGLGGVPFMGAITVLDGVDLSRNMLARAAGKDCYTQLYPDSISHHLAATADTYDFFLATDVFIYVGDLLELFTAVQAIARPAALFCFSTENLEAGNYELRKTGRFAYSRAYVHGIAAATGWTVLALEETRLRKERDSWIAGDLWILRLDALPALPAH